MKRTLPLILIVAVVLLAGCRSAPIRNVVEAPITTSSGKAPTMDQVRTAIVGAGSTLGWVMKDDGPEKLTGTLNLRSHSAVVDIPYSTTSYSIIYHSSMNLNEQDGNIHKNYNGWVQNLEQGINARLSGY